MSTATEKPIEDVVMEDSASPEAAGSAVDLEKIKLLPGYTQDGHSASFAITEEDHTLGNALRYIIMKNPDVEFCGYSIPHPSEAKLHLRIQTYEDEGCMTAVEALRKGLNDLSELCGVIEEKFTERINEGGFETEEP